MILDESSEAARNLKYWAEQVEKTVAQMTGMHDAIPRGEALPLKGNPVIKEARRPRDVIKPINLLQVKVPTDPCPYIRAAIYANKPLPKPKWGGNPPPRNPIPNNGPPPAQLSRGYLMVDTGACCTVLTTKWCETHGIQVHSKKPAFSVTAANGSEVPIVGSASFRVRLSPSLELELEDVAVQQNSNCSALLGVDVLQGRVGVLGPATIRLGSQDTE